MNESEPTAPDLERGLLHDPVALDERSHAYPWWGIVLVSVFVAYHVAILLVWNTPSSNLGKPIHGLFNEHLKMRRYLNATGNVQTWAMFAPNPHRSNMFMKVLVKDKDEEVWDLFHDIYRRRSYPYLVYDRMGKINRRLIEQQGYRRHYAAWVCREWERTHGGEAPDEVQFVKMWTKIPEPHRVIQAAGWNLGAMWYDPSLLPLQQTAEDVVRCNVTRQAQLPDKLRARYGLPTGITTYRGLVSRTWADEKAAKERRQGGKP